MIATSKIIRREIKRVVMKGEDRDLEALES